jgi:hypothetical protein
MPVIVASCANDFKHAVLNSLQVNLKLDLDIYLLDKAGNIYAFKYYSNRHVRIIENPWYEIDNLGKKSLYWSNTYDSMDPQDTNLNPWTIFKYPIKYSFELKDILDPSKISH